VNQDGLPGLDRTEDSLHRPGEIREVHRGVEAGEKRSEKPLRGVGIGIAPGHE
jgi:hypothetical protein